MTTQTKTFIEPSDILGIRLECGECGMTVTLPISRTMSFKGLGYCPNCNEAWLVMPHDTIESEIAEFMGAARTLAHRLDIWKEISESKQRKGFSVSLEIAPETEETDENKGK
jgi:hypothetical protein